jgi:glycosyltransferase involved in cell wall biosynthesis
MRVLFVHQNFPGQYRHVAPALAARPGYQVVGLGENPGDPLPGVQHVRYKPPQPAGEQTHRYIKRFEAAVRRGQTVARAALALQERGFVPDMICCHPGWGEGLFLRDVWPQARTLYYWEFYYRSQGADVGFDPPGPVSVDEACRVRTLNTTHLLSLDSADWGQTPTEWQRSQFPAGVRERISVIHEGVDTDDVAPDPAARFTLPNGRVLAPGDEVVTFIGRGLEPYRGFHVFMRCLPMAMRARPNTQFVVVGGDDPHYGARPKDAPSWRELLLRELDGQLDLGRLHFVGKIPHPALKALYSVSAAHVYLTYPFVLSWSMLEAMASGCLVIGSATPPVEEVIRHGENGLLVDFFRPDQIADTIAEVLARPEHYRGLRQAARRTVQDRFDLRRFTLPRHLALIDTVAAGQLPASVATASEG